VDFFDGSSLEHHLYRIGRGHLDVLLGVGVRYPRLQQWKLPELDRLLDSRAATAKAGKVGTVAAWNNGGEGQRLDMQIFALPKSFATQTLVSVTITDNGAPEVQRSFIAAMTVSTSLP